MQREASGPTDLPHRRVDRATAAERGRRSQQHRASMHDREDDGKRFDRRATLRVLVNDLANAQDREPTCKDHD